LRSIVQDEPQSLKERGAAEHSLSYIVSRGLSKDPMARYESLNQMGTALAAWLADQGVAEDASGVSLEAKWLGRPSDISQLGRKSWPPPRAEQISLPPSSLTPIANSSRAPTSTQAASRSKWLFAAAAVLALAAAAIALLGLRSHTAGAPVAASLSASTAQRIEMTEPPALVMIAPTAPSVVPLEQEGPPSASAASPLKPPEKKRPIAPSKPRGSAGGAPQERLSDKLLAPMTF
jgi:hypothetical protein